MNTNKFSPKNDENCRLLFGHDLFRNDEEEMITGAMGFKVDILHISHLIMHTLAATEFFLWMMNNCC